MRQISMASSTLGVGGRASAGRARGEEQCMERHSSVQNCASVVCRRFLIQRSNCIDELMVSCGHLAGQLILKGVIVVREVRNGLKVEHESLVCASGEPQIRYASLRGFRRVGKGIRVLRTRSVNIWSQR